MKKVLNFIKIFFVIIFSLIVIIVLVLDLAGANGKKDSIRECQQHPWNCIK